MPLRSRFAIALLVLSVPAQVRTAEVLDQQNDVNMSATADSAGPFSQEVGQTFAVGMAGTLSRIEVQLSRAFGAGGTVILTVYTTSAGVPDASLGSATRSWDAVPNTGFGYTSFDVSSLEIPVHVNDQLAFGIRSSGDVLFLLRSTFTLDTYDGGESKWRALSSPPGPWTSFSPTHDSGFKTYVLPNAAGLPGDFNSDGVVNAADYVTWRNHLGEPTETALNGNGDSTNGVDSGDYTLWRAHFDTSAGSGAAVVTSVPEPNVFALVVSAFASASTLSAKRGFRP